jgi:hypothetical protein
MPAGKSPSREPVRPSDQRVDVSLVEPVFLLDHCLTFATIGQTTALSEAWVAGGRARRAADRPYSHPELLYSHSKYYNVIHFDFDRRDFGVTVM